MATVELIGPKSVVCMDLPEVPAVDFIEHQGIKYFPTDDPLLWDYEKKNSEATEHGAKDIA